MAIVFGIFWQEKQTWKECLQYFSNLPGRLPCNTLDNALIHIHIDNHDENTVAWMNIKHPYSTKVDFHWKKNDTLVESKLHFLLQNELLPVQGSSQKYHSRYKQVIQVITFLELKSTDKLPCIFMMENIRMFCSTCFQLSACVEAWSS